MTLLTRNTITSLFSSRSFRHLIFHITNLLLFLLKVFLNTNPLYLVKKIQKNLMRLRIHPSYFLFLTENSQRLNFSQNRPSNHYFTQNSNQNQHQNPNNKSQNISTYFPHFRKLILNQKHPQNRPTNNRKNH